MQNRWEAETQQREAAAAKAQVPKATAAARPGRDRWGATAGSSETPTTPSADANRHNQQPPLRESTDLVSRKSPTSSCLSSTVKSPPAVDSQTVPSSRFARPSAIADVVASPPPTSPQQQPQSPRATETKTFARPPLVHQKSSTGSSGIEAVTRQMSLSSMAGNDASTTNGQPTIAVKDAKVTPSSELMGAVTRAKEGQFVAARSNAHPQTISHSDRSATVNSEAAHTWRWSLRSTA